ncbi:MAG: hypothetical protein GXO83_11430 [Chlorobi bacterium]|nr:hypothetical protein [Chlorobiota bacterium]
MKRTILFIYGILFSLIISGQDFNTNTNPSGISLPFQGQQNSQEGWRKVNFRALGTLDMGHARVMPCWPENQSEKYGNGKFPVYGYGAGITFDYRPLLHIALFTDITTHHWKFRVGGKDQRSESDWILQQTDSVTRYTGTWDQDIYFRMNAIQVRLGMRYIQPVNDKIETWAGFGGSITTWKGIVSAKDQFGSYGLDDGTGFSVFAQAGVDLYIHPVKGDKTGFIMSLFIDVGSPLAKPLRIDNLFNNGWNWDNRQGEFAVLPYRFGVAFTLF